MPRGPNQVHTAKPAFEKGKHIVINCVLYHSANLSLAVCDFELCAGQGTKTANHLLVSISEWGGWGEGGGGSAVVVEGQA